MTFRTDITRKAWMLLLALLLLPFNAPLSRADDSSSLDEIITALSTGDAEARRIAADQLAQRGEAAAPATEALVEALASDDELLRRRAVRAIAAIGPGAIASVPALIDATQDELSFVRAYAAHALGSIGAADDDSVAALVRGVTDEDALVRRVSVKALRSLDLDASVTRPLMIQVLSESDPNVVMHAISALTEEGEEVVPALIEALADKQACYWACIALGEIGPAAAPAVDALVESTQNDEPEVRFAAIMALAAIGPAANGALPRITEELDDEEISCAYAAAYAVGRIGEASDGTIEKLESLTAHDDLFLQMMTAWSLAKLDPENEDCVRRAATLVISGLTSDDLHRQQAAAAAISEGLGPAEIVRPMVLDALDDISPEAMGMVINAMIAHGSAVVERIIPVLEVEQLRLPALAVLSGIGEEAAEAVPALVELLACDDEQVVVETQFALASIGAASAPAVDSLAESLRSDNEQVRNSACYALGKIGPEAASVRDALRRYIRDNEDEFTKISGVWALQRIFPDYEELQQYALPVLITGLQSEKSMVRLEAAVALGDMGGNAQSAVEALEERLTDPDGAVRQAVIEAIEKITAP